MKTSVALLAAYCLLAGCSSMGVRSPTASANLGPTKGNQTAGTVTFVQHGQRVVVEARVTGLTRGLHGFHIHEKGDCTAADALSAGNHFNPHKEPHAAPDSAHRHAGDLGNLTADANGVAVYRIEVSGIALDTGPDSIIGRAVIVHANPDDLRTQPSGNAGSRLACGLISKGKDQWF
jgi:superoxide dismutase, Cu-Zn family